MTTDTDHAAFVRQEYRYVDLINAAVKARNPLATALTITTQMDHDSALALAQANLAANANPTTYEIVVEGVGVLGDFIGAPPRVTPNSRRFHTDGRTMTVFSLNENFETNETTLQVRG